MSSTLTTPRTKRPPREAREWTLTVAYHPDRALVGTRRLIGPQARLLLGRAPHASLPGAFDDGQISREHARLDRVGDRLTLRDLGSRNGTWVNGAEVDEAALGEGDFVRLGDVVLFVSRLPVRFAPPSHPRLLGIGEAIARVLEQVRLVGPRDTAVAIVGETGSGKELVAEALHEASGRRGPLVPLSCGSLPETMLASELFGHVRGAFTGAERERRGLVATAGGGTLFLDEVGDASPPLQASLLRVVETGEVRPVGADRTLQADVRFVVAAHPDIAERVADGRFREDLWNRVARWVIQVPPLRERPEDVPTLASTFAERFAGRPVALSGALADAMARAPWPGNVRALQAFVERAVVAAGDAARLELTPWLEEQLALQGPAAAVRAPAASPSAQARARRRSPTAAPPAEALAELLARHQGVVRTAAQALGVDRKTLYRWIEAYGLDLDAWRCS